MYHYKTCGLPNIWLSNGYRIEDTPHGQSVFIERLPDLHRAIALEIIRHSKRLSATEIRFLRKELGMTQENLAQLIGTTAQSFALWEKGKHKIPATSDKLLRILCLGYINQDVTIYKGINLLNSLDKLEHKLKRTFTEDSKRGWIPDAA